MYTYELQARPVALEELSKQPEKDSPHLLVLERRTRLIKQVCHRHRLINKLHNTVLFAFTVTRLLGSK